MNILLIDADSVIPNIALGKLSTYHKNRGDNVSLIKLNIPYYPNRKKAFHFISVSDYDKVYASVVFQGSINYISKVGIEFGGTGYDLIKTLPDEIENLDVDYSLYPDNDTSYGFITRGCIRNCYFCAVPQKEGYIRQVSTIDKIVKHSKVKFLDNNILAFDGHKKVLQELIDKNIHCQFNQGLDIRLIDKENSNLLQNLNYIGEYFFAFDDWAYLPLIKKGISYLDWRKDWQLKIFLYVNPAMEIFNVIKRIEWLKSNKCLPYIMRDITCWESKYNEFYVDIAAYCNQPGIFKKMNWKDFLEKRHPNNPDRVGKHLTLYKENV